LIQPSISSCIESQDGGNLWIMDGVQWGIIILTHALRETADLRRYPGVETAGGNQPEIRRKIPACAKQRTVSSQEVASRGS